MVLFVCPEHSGVGSGMGEGAGLLHLDRLAAVGDGGLMLSPLALASMSLIRFSWLIRVAPGS